MPGLPVPPPSPGYWLFSSRLSGRVNRARCIVQQQHFFQIRWSLGLLCRMRCPRVCKTARKYQKGSGELSHSSAISQGFLALALLTCNMKEFLPDLLRGSSGLFIVLSPWYGFKRCGSCRSSALSLILSGHSCRRGYPVLYSAARLGWNKPGDFPPGLNRLVLKQNGRRAFPSSAGRRLCQEGAPRAHVSGRDVADHLVIAPQHCKEPENSPV